MSLCFCGHTRKRHCSSDGLNNSCQIDGCGCSYYATPTKEQKEIDRQDSSEPDSSTQRAALYNRIIAKAEKEFRQKARICEKCHQLFLQDEGVSADGRICTSCWIATREMNPSPKIGAMARIDEAALDNIAANIRERKISRFLLRRLRL